MFARHLLLGASALAGMASLTAPAFATDYNTAIYGGGASLPAPYLRQAGNCYGNDVSLLKRTGSSSAAVVQTTSNFCADSYNYSNNTVNYISTGSGTGLAGFFSNNPTKFGPLTDGTSYYGDVDFAASETALGDTEVAIYNTGGTYQGVSVAGANNPTGTSPNGLATYGAMIQIPMQIAPVAIAYNRTYVNTDGSTYILNNGVAIELTQAQYCGIFSGQITSWNQITDQNGVPTLKNNEDETETFDAPITVVVRSDSSGTTSLFTRHLATVCGNHITTNNPFIKSVSTFTSLNNLGTVVGADQSSGVAAAVGTTDGAIGYVGLDYIGTYATNTGSTVYPNLKVAKLENKNGNFVEPSPASALAAFSAAFTAPSSSTDLANPAKWVVPATTYTDGGLANPVGSDSYPIVGTSNFLLYTCYGTANRANTVKDFINWFYTANDVNAASTGILEQAGYAPVPSTFRTLIKDTFITGDSNDLEIEATSTVTTNKCYGKGA